MKFPITRRRKQFAAQHQQMDPNIDHGQIFETLFTREFPVEFLLAAEIAQIRTFMFPRGSRLLHKTGEFENNSLKRLDDTRAILVEMGRDGFDSPRAKVVADHLNQIHAFYDIPNREFLHTLSTFIYDVCHIVNRYGWRKLTRHEELAIYNVYCTMGELMNIKDIPDTFEAFYEWRVQYEEQYKGYDPANQKITAGIFRGAKQMLPAILRPFVIPFSFSLAEPELPELLGHAPPRPLTRAFFQGVMWLRKQFNKQFTLWDTLSFEELIVNNFKSYPNGYDPLSIGPTKLIKQIHKKRAAAQHPAGCPF